MLSLYEFNRNNHEQRIALVWKHGNFLEVRQSRSYHIGLYSMGKFFAEIWYRPADNEIELVRGFNSKAMLEPYLDQVDLTDITG